MKKLLTCIICPNSCQIEVEIKDGEEKPCVLSVKGNSCPKGEGYARKELTAPERTLTTSCKVIGGELPLVSVRLSKPIPKQQLFAAMLVISKIEVHAPVKTGDVVLSSILGYDSDVIVTKDIAAVAS